MKRCPKCQQIKSLSEFNKDHRAKDGHQVDCRICHHKYQKKYRKTEKGKAAQKRYAQSKKGKAARKSFFTFNPNHKKATHAVSNAIRDGKLTRPDTHWLDVVPVCTNCHKKHRKKIA